MAGAGQIRSGRKTVSAAGTAERLVASSTIAEWVHIQALVNNTGAGTSKEVVIGGSDVVAAVATREGLLVAPGGGFQEEIGVRIPGPIDLADIWVDAITNDNGVNFAYMEARN
jgi:hypothetical protein